MKIFNIRLFVISIYLLTGIVLTSFLQENEPLKYTQVSTISHPNPLEQSYILTYNDTLNSETIYLRKSSDHIPLHYFKKINTEVCFDKECRTLNIIVYWNITGRYLGFELPKGEFLSKQDHEPFSETEYRKLNKLLADNTLPFARIPFEKLVNMPSTETDEVDAISGATTENVAKIVIKGAAYTTYKLWNIVYGSTMDLVAQLTETQLTSELISLILKSPDISDRIWALDRIDQATELNQMLKRSLLDIISGDDFYLIYNTMNTISPVHLNSGSLQMGLFSVYKKGNPSVQKMIIEKLREAPYLDKEIVVKSRLLLSQLNGKQLGDLLKLYSTHAVYDKETCRAVSKILQNENRYISKQAFKFLLKSETTDENVKILIKNYKFDS